MVQAQSLEDLVTSLFDCVVGLPHQDAVKAEVGESLRAIGSHRPDVLLSSAHTYLVQHNKLSSANRAFVLRAVGAVLGSTKVIEELDEQLALLVINLATQEMTMTKDADTDWAEAARDVLVVLSHSKRLCGHVMDALLQKFPPGLTTPPHRYVVLALASVAEHNPRDFVNFLTDVFSRSVPLLPHIKGEPQRCAWARAICAFAEAVRECQTVEAEVYHENGNSSHDSDVNGKISPLDLREQFADQAEAVYDVIVPWMSSKDPKVRAEAAECVGELCLLIRPQRVSEDLKKLVTTLLGLYRKNHSEQQMITRGVCRFLEAICGDDNCPLDAYLDELLNALFPQVCIDPDDASAPNPTAIRNQSETFRCFHVAG